MSSKTKMSDIAKAAGVSVATVSRALNQPNSVKPETVNLIMETINRLEYSRNRAASSSSERKLIVVSVTLEFGEFHTEVLKGITASLNSHGYTLIIWTKSITSQTISQFLRIMKASSVSGIIILDESLNINVLNKIKSHFPVIQVSEHNPDSDIPHVSIDNQKSAYNATEYILSRNRNKIAFISGPLTRSYNQARFSGFMQALEDAGTSILPNWKLHLPELNYDLALGSISQILTSADRPNAIFACSDLLGIAAINAAVKNHIAVPDDLIIVGFGNINYSVMSSPTLTTVSQPMFQMGYRCSEMLYQLIVNPSVQLQSVVLQTELIIREST